MKRYMLFCGENYYPNRGMGDFVDSFDHKETPQIKGKLHIENEPFSWYQIYDLELQQIIEES